MFSYTKIFNLEGKNIVAELHINQNLIGSYDVLDPCVVGLEPGGKLLLAWTAASPQIQAEEQVTHFAVYDLTSQKCQLLLIHDKQLEVINATLNSSHTLLGFVAKEEIGASQRHKQYVYKAFVAEVSPPNRIFYLNLERELMIKLKFVHLSSADTAESHLLVFLHKKSIGVYHLAMTTDSQKNTLLRGEPKKEHVAMRFHWCQYLSGHLYTLHFQKTGHDSNGVTIHRPVLQVFQQMPNASFDKKLELFLDLPIPYSRSSSRCQYSDTISDTVSDRHVNLRVLHANGNLCVCYQHPPARERKKSGTLDEAAVDEEHHSELKISIVMVHQNKTMTLTFKDLPPTVHLSHIFFSHYQGNYIIVELCRVFSHLLNVETCHQTQRHLMTFHKTDERHEANPVHYTPFLEDSGSDYSSFIDLTTSSIYQIDVCPVSLLRTFPDSSLFHKLAVLHFTILQAKNEHLIKHLLLSICESIVDFDSFLLLQEFLVAGSYAQLKQKAPPKVLACFPKGITIPRPEESNTDTTFSSFSFKQEINFSSIKEADIRFHSISSTQRSSWKEMNNQRLNSKGEQIFSCVHLALSLNQEEASEKIPNSTNGDVFLNERKKSLISKFGNAAKSAFTGFRRVSVPANLNFYHTPVMRSRGFSDPLDSLTSDSDSDSSRQVEAALSMPPCYHGPTSSEKDQKQLIRMSKMSEAVSDHLAHWLPDEDVISLSSIASTYVNCQLRQSRDLLKTLWCVSGESDNHEFYFILERYFYAVEDLGFPIPYNFNEYFMKRGFLSLDFNLFLQYCDQDVFTISQDFVMDLIREYGAEQDFSDRILQLISRLSMDAAVNCLKKWPNKTAYLYLAKHFASLHLTEDGSHPREEVLKRDPNVCYKVYDEERKKSLNHPPLNHLMNHVQKTKRDKQRSSAIPTQRKQRALSEDSLLPTIPWP